MKKIILVEIETDKSGQYCYNTPYNNCKLSNGTDTCRFNKDRNKRTFFQRTKECKAAELPISAETIDYILSLYYEKIDYSRKNNYDDLVESLEEDVVKLIKFQQLLENK